jgi:hypothetical protein
MFSQGVYLLNAAANAGSALAAFSTADAIVDLYAVVLLLIAVASGLMTAAVRFSC